VVTTRKKSPEGKNHLGPGPLADGCQDKLARRCPESALAGAILWPTEMASEPWEDEMVWLELSPSGATSVTVNFREPDVANKRGLPVISHWLPTARKTLAVGQKMSPLARLKVWAVGQGFAGLPARSQGLAARGRGTPCGCPLVRAQGAPLHPPLEFLKISSRLANASSVAGA
jgi:hypothetical protein